MTPAGKGPHDPWFHIGTLEVTTAMAVVLLSVVSFVVFAVDPQLLGWLALDPERVLHGQVWRLITWPFSYVDISFWDAVTVFIFWYFGQDLEKNLLGRTKFLKFVLFSTLALGLLLVGIYAAFPFFGVLWTLNTIELMVLLLWIAEWPTRRFMFNVPAWVLGLALVGMQVLSLTGHRAWQFLLHFVVGIALCALIGRHYGALAEHHWVPDLVKRRTPKAKRQRKHFDPSRPTVVSGPWDASLTPEPRVTPDEARMNALLDKIHAHGQDSLSAKEKAELLELRERMRRR